MTSPFLDRSIGLISLFFDVALCCLLFIIPRKLLEASGMMMGLRGGPSFYFGASIFYVCVVR